MQPNRQNEQFGGGPAMDIQRPAPVSQPNDVIRPSAEALGRPATMEYTRPRPTVSGQAPGASFSPSPTTDGGPSFTPQSPAKKKSKKGLVIGIVVFLLVIVGAGAAYYFFMMDTTEPAPVATEPAVVEESTAVEATPEGVDKTIESIDKQLNSVDDSADFTPNDVSDDALGL